MRRRKAVEPVAEPSFVDEDNLDTVPVPVVTAEVVAEHEKARAEAAANADAPADAGAEVKTDAEAEASAEPEVEISAQPAEPIEPDAVLLAARDQARNALAEITDAVSIGEDAGHEVHEAHVLTLFFNCTLPGYPGWRWAATLARVDEKSDVNVLEVQMLPGPGSLTAPDWLPWSERLAQYHDAQALEAESADGDHDEDDEDDDDPDSDILVNDFSDFDDEIDGAEVDGDEDEDEDAEGEDAGEADESDDDSGDHDGDDEEE